MQDDKDHENQANNTTKGNWCSSSNWPQQNGNLLIAWQRIQTNHLKGAQWYAKKHTIDN